MSSYDYQPNGTSDYTGPVSSAEGNNLNNQGVSSAADNYNTSVSQNSVATPTEPPSYTYDISKVNPMNDLQYLSFLRGYGVDSSNARAQTAYQRATLNAQMQAQIPQFEQQRGYGQTDATNNAAARGAGRSTSYATQQNHVNAGIDNSEINLRNSVNSQLGQDTINLTSQLNSLDAQKAEQELNSRMSMVQAMNQQTAYQRAIQQLGYQPYGY